MTDEKSDEKDATTTTDEHDEDDSGLDDLIEKIEEIPPFSWLLGKMRD